MGYDAPFAGLKVVDLAQGVAGPYCGMLMAQHGANVIKVEPPGDGDWSRTISKRYGAHTAFSIPTNLGKRSVALDLKTQRGKGVLWRLIEGADVLLEGFPAGRTRAARFRLRRRCGARAAHPLPLCLGLRPDRPACRSPRDGPGPPGLHRTDGRQQG